MGKSREDSEVAEPQRDRRGRLRKGSSGNPAGRPSNPANHQELVQLARSFTGEAMERIAQLMRTADKDATCLRAAEVLVARGWGEPAKPLAVPGEDEDHEIEVHFIARRSPSSS